MWRAFFCAIGVSALILGGEFLLIERASLTMPGEEKKMEQYPFFQNVNATMHTREFVPPEWAPWSLLSVGAVVVLYSSTARE